MGPGHGARFHALYSSILWSVCRVTYQHGFAPKWGNNECAHMTLTASAGMNSVLWFFSAMA